MSQPSHPFLLVHADEVPVGDDWLAPSERSVLAALSTPRRRDWRSGRWALKRLLVDEEHLSRLSVRAADDGCPEVFVGERRLPRRVSITHRGAWAAAVVSADGREVGIDLELVEPRSRRFVQDYFTEAEAASTFRSSDPAAHAVTVWSAKESALKCARTGLRRDTRSVEIGLAAPPDDGGSWERLAIRDLERSLDLDAWALRRGPLVMTLASCPGWSSPAACWASGLGPSLEPELTL